MRKFRIALLMTLLLTFMLSTVVLASDKPVTETSSEMALSKDVRNLKVTIPGIESENLSGDIEVFYTGKDCDIFASLSKENNYTVDLAVYDGEYELYQILYRGEENYEFLCADRVGISGNAEMDLLMRAEDGFRNADKLNKGSITGYARIGAVIASEEEKAQAEEQYKALEKEVEQIQSKATQDEMAKPGKQKKNSNDIILISIGIAFMILAAAIIVVALTKKKNQ